ncbi:MAG TPA: flavoprotein [Candidatus Ozemobacteraceae bacterium]|nr:flavoprotein [Candidatus Ozemobacteraceae bacterium]
MSHNQIETGMVLKPLLVCCCPEQGTEADPLVELPAVAGLAPWEVALSLSAQARGLLRRIAPMARTFCAHEADELIGGLGRFDLVAVTPLSLNTLAKFALGLRDSFPSRLLAVAAERGLPILLDERQIPAADSSLNPHLMKIYRRYWDQVRLGTVREFHPDRLAEAVAAVIRTRQAVERAVPASGRAVITRDDVILAQSALQPLRVPRGAIVTDLAREEAAARGVSFYFE